MILRITLAAAAASLAAPALAQPVTPAGPLAAAPVEDLVPVAFDTSLGRIVIALDRGRAPKTVANFLAYVDQRKFDGETFYRAMRYGDGGFIQGGITSDAAKLAKPVAHESTRVTGLKHVAGTVAMARTEPGSAQADFFILTTPIPAFDAGGEGGDADGFAAFGQVVEGMDVIKKILAGPFSATKGEGVMRGQMLDPTVKIVKAARVKQ